MKYRIEPKPEGKTSVPAFTRNRRYRGSPGVGGKPTHKGYDPCIRVGWYILVARDIIVSELAPDASVMDDCDNVPMRWRVCKDVQTVASLTTEAGCRQIERWEGKPQGTYTPRPAYDR